MSFNSRNKESAEERTIPDFSSADVNFVSASNSDIPITPFMGVRISWLMLARNWLLAWFAFPLVLRLHEMLVGNGQLLGPLQDTCFQIDLRLNQLVRHVIDGNGESANSSVDVNSGQNGRLAGHRKSAEPSLPFLKLAT